ncbi:thioredoxin domain-containing protein, partial [Candidatus Saccharibacteria bacterium]|nr:thioredoxin domain-containing protein [Candidatus Saccharibacteria bacterium]
MTPLRWAIFGAIFIVILGALVLTKQSDNIDVSNVNENKAVTKKSESEIADHIYGNKDSKVTLIEYGDFQCPACKSYYPIVKQLKEEYKDKIKFQFRNYPLSQIHPNAFMAARASEAAGQQNKFFEMHDLLYENADAWSSQVTTNPQPIFENFAKEIGLDINKYTIDYASETTNSTINADKQEGNNKGVNGTPTYFINGVKIDNGQITSVEGFSKV